ncbi:hypothetical protein DEH81_06490 [Pectobacterium zantedeschiae]|nr:hypothetical protein DEH81_06490 [Pectobacterium zantedeschiae]
MLGIFTLVSVNDTTVSRLLLVKTTTPIFTSKKHLFAWLLVGEGNQKKRIFSPCQNQQNNDQQGSLYKVGLSESLHVVVVTRVFPTRKTQPERVSKGLRVVGLCSKRANRLSVPEVDIANVALH